MKTTRSLRWFVRVRVWAGIGAVIALALAEAWVAGHFGQSSRYWTQTAEPVFATEHGMAGLFAAR
jgi:hypothetical protein